MIAQYLSKNVIMSKGSLFLGQKGFGIQVEVLSITKSNNIMF